MAFALPLRPHRSEARTTPHSAGRHAALPLQAFLGQGVAEARRSQHGTEPQVSFPKIPREWMGHALFTMGNIGKHVGKETWGNMMKYGKFAH